MATQITRVQSLTDRVVSIKIYLSAKDASDDALIKKFGDIIIPVSGEFSDPNDLSYPKFRVEAGDPVSFFTVGEIKTIFFDNLLTLEDLQKRADLWADKIQLDIQNAMTNLRNKVDNTTITTVVTI